MDAAARIEAVRQFNRFYTRRVGVLKEGLLGSSFTLTEARILWELAHAESAGGMTATELGRLLDLDAGYLSRLLKSLKERDLVASARSAADARQSILRLSPNGQRAFEPLDQESKQHVNALLSTLNETQQTELLRAFARVQALLSPPEGADPGADITLRPHRPGDMGWVVSRHGELYADEYGWDMRFEAMVARIAADFIDRFDARREACWIAERDDVRLGAVCLVQARDEVTAEPLEGVGQLRLLIVDPAARGLGVGGRLVAECHRFARSVGYQRVQLWTNSQLDAAKHIYRKAGYQLAGTEAFEGFGQSLVGETWVLDLVGTEAV